MIPEDQWLDVHEASLEIHKAVDIPAAISTAVSAIRRILDPCGIDHRRVENKKFSDPLRSHGCRITGNSRMRVRECDIALRDGEQVTFFVRFAGIPSSEELQILQMIGEHLASAARHIPPPAFSSYNGSLLSEREQEIFPLIADGRSNDEIAITLKISQRTVEKHVSSILQKCGLENRKLLIASFGRTNGY